MEVQKTNSIGFFAKSQPTRALFERSELCRSVGGSAFCKKSVNGIRFSYLYLFYVFMNTRYISVIQIRIYISNSSCAAFIAFTISSWFTSTVTRISDVEIIRMFTSALYKALNIRAAIP